MIVDEGKLHHATVTQSELRDEGSSAVDTTLPAMHAR